MVGRSEALRRAVDAERQRCLALVAAYRETIQRKFSQIPNYSLEREQNVKRVVNSLLQIEADIRHPAAKEAITEVVLPGDFSIEEIERAVAMIEEQERNPFEV